MDPIDWNRLRFIDDGGMPGSANMAADEALARSAETGGEPVLRVYAFDPACVSIGRFQEYPGNLDIEECARRGIDVVRRPTGGLAIPHVRDFTYCFCAPVTGPGAGRRMFEIIGSGILAALSFLGIEARISRHADISDPGGTWCFEQARGIDVEWHARKICGSAQRRFGQAVIQHGSLFLSRGGEEDRLAVSGGMDGGDERFVALDEASGAKVSWDEAREAFRRGFSDALDIEVWEGGLSADERSRALRLELGKYSDGSWLRDGTVRF